MHLLFFRGRLRASLPALRCNVTHSHTQHTHIHTHTHAHTRTHARSLSLSLSLSHTHTHTHTHTHSSCTIAPLISILASILRPTVTALFYFRITLAQPLATRRIGKYSEKSCVVNTSFIIIITVSIFFSTHTHTHTHPHTHKPSFLIGHG
jgi:hypothetical protein